MKREDILAMPAGRELDRMVMEKVFNAKKGNYGEEEVWYHYDDNGEPDYEWSCYNSPSTDISAAWEVVEKFQIFKVTRIEILEGHYHHKAEIFTHKVKPYEIEAPTAPEAICKAALLTVLEESL